MTRVQFGWALPGRPPRGMRRDVYMEGVQRGFEVIRGSFDSFWFVDHLQEDDSALLEGWTALTYFAGLAAGVYVWACGAVPVVSQSGFAGEDGGDGSVFEWRALCAGDWGGVEGG